MLPTSQKSQKLMQALKLVVIKTAIQMKSQKRTKPNFYQKN